MAETLHNTAGGATNGAPSTTLSRQEEKKPPEKKVITLDDLELLTTLGTGTFGRVRLVRYLGDTHHYALKILKKAEVIRLKQVEHTKNEIRILGMMDHPFLTKMEAFFHDESRLYVMMEYIAGGELFSYLRRVEKFPNEEARFFACEVILAFEYMHSLDIIYRDLKPENVLISTEGHIKITDFGFAKIVTDRTWTVCGTPEYLAPEILQNVGHGKSVDWWATGILIYEMIVGFAPFFDENPLGIYQKILSGKPPLGNIPDKFAKLLVKGLLEKDRTKRLGCMKGGVAQIKNHKWFTNVNWQAVADLQAQPAYLPAVSGEADTSQFDAYPDSLEDRAAPLTAEDRARFAELDAF
uniref:cAMP-dependent protein kinase n=1 Tax=Heterosigma akashiwo TaxID=2829 RepID=A0A6V1MD63_HETAK|mmetsp:Transcript_1028/g.1508  ORF Transcript_1028/g.1508 Transcript_1028/m.1508 type:complete len:353 (+) Transcript_1028:34-1092(+)